MEYVRTFVALVTHNFKLKKHGKITEIKATFLEFVSVCVYELSVLFISNQTEPCCTQEKKVLVE